MSSTSSISRVQAPAERGSQRSERAAAGDFAALLDGLPAPDRGPLRAPADRSRHERPAEQARADRREPAPARSRPADHRPDDRPAPAHASDPAPAARRAAAQVEPPVGAAAAGEPAAEISATVPLVTPATALPAPSAIAAPPSADPPAVASSTTTPASPAAAAATTVAAYGFATTPLPFAPAAATVAAAPGTASGQPNAAAVPGLSIPATSAIPAPAGGATVADAAAGAPVAASGPAMTAADGLSPAPSEPAPSAAPVAEPAVQDALAAPAGGAGGGSATAGGRDGHEGGTQDGAVEGEPAPGTPAPGPPAASAPTAPATGRLLDGMPAGAHSAVPLERAPRAVAQLLKIGAEGGVSHARIALRPVELGGIEIFLQVGPAGLTAQVIAESPEAARMLQQAGEDLRRSLAGHDVELVSLDVSTSSEHSQRDDLRSREGLADFGDAAAAPRRSGDADSEAAEPTSPAPIVLELPDGLLVDVLA